MTTSEPSPAELSVDIVIFGGGIAGLWILNQLHRLGYSALLLESEALGSGQSLASQGIIHGGLKYALGGTLSTAAKAIAAMPARWQRCLQGDDPVDLTGCRILSARFYMWSEGSYRSRLKTFLGSRSLRGKVEAVRESEYPQCWQPARGQGSLYRLPDFVIDTGSLLTTLSSRHQDRVFRLGSSRVVFSDDTRQDTLHIRIASGKGDLSLKAKRVILAAGAGNADLLEQAGLQNPQMQKRPLNMVMIRGNRLPELFVHCIGDSFSLTPRLTLTSHPCVDGDVAWYLGGELAEAGVELSDREQITAAKQYVAELLPWVNTSDTRWSCLRVDRAEGREAGLHRPDSVFLRAERRFLVAWPTKFTLSPVLADTVQVELAGQGVRPGPGFDHRIVAQHLEPAVVAQPPWETGFD